MIGIPKREVSLKRFLPIIPIFLLLLVNACGDITASISAAEWTAVWVTQTACLWTPTSSPTPDPNESNIVYWLNMEFLAANPLEQTLDARFMAVDASFPSQPGASFPIFRLVLRCTCGTNAQCCTAERGFVVAINAMQVHAGEIIKEVPGGTSHVEVVCFNQLTRIGAMTATWLDVQAYLLQQIDGHQLGWRVTPGAISGIP